jgi:hypothetical protein
MDRIDSYARFDTRPPLWAVFRQTSVLSIPLVMCRLTSNIHRALFDTNPPLTNVVNYMIPSNVPAQLHYYLKIIPARLQVVYSAAALR